MAAAVLLRTRRRLWPSAADMVSVPSGRGHTYRSGAKRWSPWSKL